MKQKKMKKKIIIPQMNYNLNLMLIFIIMKKIINNLILINFNLFNPIKKLKLKIFQIHLMLNKKLMNQNLIFDQIIVSKIFQKIFINGQLKHLHQIKNYIQKKYKSFKKNINFQKKI